VSEQTIFETLLSSVNFAIPIAVLATLAVLVIRGWMLRRAARNRDTIVQMHGTVPPEENAATVVKRIDAAKASNDKTPLAGLYLALARAHEKTGDDEARMSALRSAAGCGALHGPHGSHALARLQLAEAAYASGDLTSACEQWHLARAAFLADGQTEEHARVDKRMRDNGCPTDWVLTDF
jgi:hypothetical protein